MINDLKRQKMEKLVYDTFNALDKSGRNTERYKKLFSGMTNAQFDTFFKDLFANENEYLILNLCDYEIDLRIEDIERAAKVLNVPLFERIAFPHYTLDKDNVIVTKEAVPVGYCHIKRTQQTVAKKNGISTSANIRSSLTGQVTAGDKNGRQSDLENATLIGMGAVDILKELNGPRSDDPVMKQQMLTAINRKGFVSLEDMESDPANKTTLNTVNVYFLGMNLNTDLVTKGLMTKSTLDEES